MYLLLLSRTDQTILLMHLKIVNSAQAVFLCIVFISEQIATLAVYNTNWSVFIAEVKSVYCAVRTGSLNKTAYASALNG